MAKRPGRPYAPRMNARVSFVIALLSVAVLAGCQTKQPAAEPPPAPLDEPTAEAMLLRSLQAEEAGDVEAEKADLFPRQNNILMTCAKLRVDNGKLAAVAMRDENGNVPHVTGVTVSGLHQQGAHTWVGTYQAQGNSAYSGSEMFIWANGRWWIKCNV